MKHLRYVGNGSQSDISKIGSIREFCQTKYLFPNLRQLEVECWPLTPSECSFLFCLTLERLTLVGPQPSMYKSRSELQGPYPDGQYQTLCITKLVKRSPRLKTIHSLVLQRLKIPGQRDTLTLSVIEDETIRTADELKYSRPQWLDKVMHIEKFGNSHRFACKQYVENNPACPPLEEDKDFGASSVLCPPLIFYAIQISLNMEQVYLEFSVYIISPVAKSSLTYLDYSFSSTWSHMSCLSDTGHVRVLCPTYPYL